jgi:GGDEF domain-containing protein
LLDARINSFEPFKDVYGFVAGDDVLRFTAMLIGEVVDELGTISDFIGHAGGDNFIIVTVEAQANAIKTRLKERFDNEVQRFSLHGPPAGICAGSGSRWYNGQSSIHDDVSWHCVAQRAVVCRYP